MQLWRRSAVIIAIASSAALEGIPLELGLPVAAERVRSIILVLAFFAFHKHRSKCIGSCWLAPSWRWPRVRVPRPKTPEVFSASSQAAVDKRSPRPRTLRFLGKGSHSTPFQIVWFQFKSSVTIPESLPLFLPPAFANACISCSQDVAAPARPAPRSRAVGVKRPWSH